MNTTDTIGGASVASFTNSAGWTFTLARVGDGWEIARSNGGQTRAMPQASGDDLAQGLATLSEWEAAFNGDPTVLVPPAGHETVRDYLARGGVAAEHPSAEYQLDVLACRPFITRRGYQLAMSRHVAYIAVKAPHMLRVPFVNDTRTEAEKSAADLSTFRSALWSNELLMDDDLADRFEAGLNDEQRRYLLSERDLIGEDEDLDRHPFIVEAVELDEYRCGMTGEVRHGHAIAVRPRGGWVADEVREVADHLVFSPAAVRAALGDVA